MTYLLNMICLLAACAEVCVVVEVILIHCPIYKRPEYYHIITVTRMSLTQNSILLHYYSYRPVTDIGLSV